MSLLSLAQNPILKVCWFVYFFLLEIKCPRCSATLLVSNLGDMMFLL